MPSQEARQVFTDLYETRFGIYDHTPRPGKSGLASILHHPREEYYLNSPLRDAIEEFAIYNLGELFHISLYEYLNLPKPMVDLIRNIKDDVLKKRESLISLVESRIRDSYTDKDKKK